MSRRFLGIGDVAKALSVSPATVRLWEKHGVIEPAARTGAGERRIWQEEELEAMQIRIAERQRAMRPAAGTQLVAA